MRRTEPNKPKDISTCPRKCVGTTTKQDICGKFCAREGWAGLLAIFANLTTFGGGGYAARSSSSSPSVAEENPISSPSYALGGNLLFLVDLQDASWKPNIKFFYVKGRMGTIRETDLPHERLRAVGGIVQQCEPMYHHVHQCAPMCRNVKQCVTPWRHHAPPCYADHP